ncbi:MAG TPA: DinB family protein [Candidatus Limnocylindrales bacterium]
MATLHPQIERLRTARDRVVKLRGRVEMSKPVPEDLPRSREWVARETLAHIDELLPYWLGEIERVLAGTKEPVPFGRTSNDLIRLMTVDRDRTLPVGELYGRLDAGLDRVVRRLLELDDRQCGRRGLHPQRGEMTVQQIVEVMLAAHIEEHCEQLAVSLDRGIAAKA